MSFTVRWRTYSAILRAGETPGGEFPINTIVRKDKTGREQRNCSVESQTGNKIDAGLYCRTKKRLTFVRGDSISINWVRVSFRWTIIRGFKTQDVLRIGWSRWGTWIASSWWQSGDDRILPPANRQSLFYGDSRLLVDSCVIPLELRLYFCNHWRRHILKLAIFR